MVKRILWNYNLQPMTRGPDGIEKPETTQAQRRRVSKVRQILRNMDAQRVAPASPREIERELTAEERAVYDRQIRLWGTEAQRRLSQARVAIVGDVLAPLSQELAKNIVLAGVAGVSFVAEDGVASGRGFLGDSVEVVTENLSAMNPLVQVTKLDSVQQALRDAHIICSVGRTMDKDRELAVACGLVSKPLLCGRMAGFVGWFHLGLGNFTYTPEGKEAITEMYPLLDAAFDAPWGGERKRSAFAWHMVHALLMFEKEHGRMPGKELGEFKAFYQNLAENKSATNVAPSEIVSGLDKTASVSLPAYAAIVGGVWGREVVKVLSQRDEPLNNLFLYNSRNSVGAVEKVGGAN